MGLPIDASSKSKGIAALAIALNNAEIARAQLIALHLRFPDSQPVPNSRGFTRDGFVEFIRALNASNLIKADWDPDEHPRWPAGAPESQGGRFAPRGESETDGANFSDGDALGSRAVDERASSDDKEVASNGSNAGAAQLNSAVAYDDQGKLLDEAVYRGYFHDAVVIGYAEYLRKAGLTVATEVPLEMADGSGAARIDIIAKGKGFVRAVEVKTGDDPDVTPGQLLVYPHLMLGASVISESQKIAKFGFVPGQVLPPIPIELMYVSGPEAEPEYHEFDPKKMLDEFYRRYGRAVHPRN